jgi:hypothetical protein
VDAQPTGGQQSFLPARTPSSPGAFPGRRPDLRAGCDRLGLAGRTAAQPAATKPWSLSDTLAHAKLVVDRILLLGKQTDLDGLSNYSIARARYHLFLPGIFSKQRLERAPDLNRGSCWANQTTCTTPVGLPIVENIYR